MSQLIHQLYCSLTDLSKQYIQEFFTSWKPFLTPNQEPTVLDRQPVVKVRGARGRGLSPLLRFEPPAIV